MQHCSDALPNAKNARRVPLYRYTRQRWWALLAVIDFIGSALYTVARRLGLVADELSDGPVRSILLVQLDHLGDAILSTGMVRELARRYPDAMIEVLAAPWNAEVFLALPAVSRIHICRRNRFGPHGRWVWPLAIVCWALRLRRRQFDLGIDVRGELPLALLLWLAAVKRRVGWAAGGGGFLLTDSARFRPDEWQVDARARLLAAIDRRPPATLPVPSPTLEPTPGARDWLEERLGAMLESGIQLIIAHISAGTQAKRWPTAHWQELLGRLIVERGDIHLALVGSTADRAIADNILGRNAWPNVSNFTGLLSLDQLAALIERAVCFVGADSGPAHLAGAVGTPAVVLFSGTNSPTVWRPAGEVTVVRVPVDCSPCYSSECPVAGHPCMTRIEPQRVVDEVIAKLNDGRESPQRHRDPELDGQRTPQPSNALRAA